MFLLISVNCSQSPCVSKPVKPNTFFNVVAHGYLAVKNGTIVITYNKQALYLIAVYMNPAGNRDHQTAAKFFIFDPVARRYICLMNKKKHRFVAKRYPKPEELCWFLEIAAGDGVDVRYVVKVEKEEFALRFSKKGKLMRPISKPNRAESFRSRPVDHECSNATSRFCNATSHQKRHHHKQSLTIQKICSWN
ncbi:hypothetical protein Trydic_g19092 [Trypoxylus dichotomus]